MSDKQELKTEDIIREAERKGCPVQRASYYINEFLRELMCGKCFPCSLGTYEAATRLKDVISARGTEDDIHALQVIADMMIAASRCKKGKDTGQFILKCTEAASFMEHLRGWCPDRECISLSEYRIVPEKCVMCGECQIACRYGAVIGEKKVPFLSGDLPFEIIGEKCVQCGECLRVCPNDAIMVIDKKDAVKVEAES
jgi:ferredoxin